MKIRISYFHGYPGDQKQGGGGYHIECYELKTKVNCEEISTGTIIAIAVTICLVVVIVVAIVVKKLGGNCKTPEEPKERNELNDLYGTYYHGVEYNTANDNNPRYNEDGGKGNAVVTDANAHYYQLASATNDNPRYNQNQGNKNATSPNENNYARL